MSATIEERVQRGAMLLDATMPGWATKIDTRRLNLGWTHRCLFGQLSGSFQSGYESLEISIREAGELGFHAEVFTRHEIAPPIDYLLQAQMEREWKLLRTAWLAEIALRLAAPVAVDEPELVEV